MAKKANTEIKHVGNGKKKTSIGKSCRSRPVNKHKRRNWKKSRGQGDGRRR